MYVVVNQDGRYYTGKWLKLKESYPFLWTPYSKQAKRYQKQGWAQQVADRCGGRVQAVGQRAVSGQ
jgi:hypothetical protein